MRGEPRAEPARTDAPPEARLPAAGRPERENRTAGQSRIRLRTEPREEWLNEMKIGARRLREEEGVRCSGGGDSPAHMVGARCQRQSDRAGRGHGGGAKIFPLIHSKQQVTQLGLGQRTVALVAPMVDPEPQNGLGRCSCPAERSDERFQNRRRFLSRVQLVRCGPSSREGKWSHPGGLLVAIRAWQARLRP